jgi:HAD superfamily hydrolase (TIGR01549 family)
MGNTSESAVLFDVDGTLVDSTYHHAIAWQRAFDRVHLPVPLWRIHRSVGMGGDRLVAAVAGDRAEERHGDELRDRWREEYARIKDEVFPLPGASELVRHLIGSGHRVALASSGDPEFTQQAVATLGLRRDVELVTTAEDAEDSKPAADLIVTTLHRMGGVRRAVMVGDTPYDVESAARAGLRCVGLRSGGYAEAELRDAGAVVVADAPEDLLDLDWEKYLSEPDLEEKDA